MRLALKSILVSAWDLESTQEMATLVGRNKAQGESRAPLRDLGQGPTSGASETTFKKFVYQLSFFWSEDIIDF